MKIMVCMRIEIERLLKRQKLDERVAIISITDTTKDPVEFDPIKHGCCWLPLVFQDYDRPTEDALMITDKIADEIALFAIGAEKTGIKVLLVHCTAGVSRSPGVAAAIEKYFYGDDSKYFKDYAPNRLVYRKVLEALHRHGDKEEQLC